VLVQLGIWFYTAFSHRFLEERQRDYFVMWSHHVATLALVHKDPCCEFLK